MGFNITTGATVAGIASSRWETIIGMRLNDGRRAVYWASADSGYTDSDGIASALFVEGEEDEEWDEFVNFEVLAKRVNWDA